MRGRTVRQHRPGSATVTHPLPRLWIAPDALVLIDIEAAATRLEVPAAVVRTMQLRQYKSRGRWMFDRHEVTDYLALLERSNAFHRNRAAGRHDDHQVPRPPRPP